jgi:hypothetical protein
MLCLAMHGVVASSEAEMAYMEARLGTLVLAYSRFCKVLGVGEGSGRSRMDNIVKFAKLKVIEIPWVGA